MKNLFVKTYNKVLVVLLGFLGFVAGCIRTEYGSPVDEYCCDPFADFILSGYVKSNETNQPIENIKITMDNVSTFSDSVGYYSLLTQGDPVNQNFDVKFEDVDGAENGNFNNLDTNINFPGNFVDGSDEYRGFEEINLNIQLDEEK